MTIIHIKNKIDIFLYFIMLCPPSIKLDIKTFTSLPYIILFSFHVVSCSSLPIVSVSFDLKQYIYIYKTIYIYIYIYIYSHVHKNLKRKKKKKGEKSGHFN